MPEYNGNNIYLEINGIDVRSRWRSFELSENIDEEDTSAGAGIEWKKRASKLREVSGTIILIYDSDSAAADQAALVTANDIVPVVYGPEGSAAGKPCHDQDFKINSVNGPTTNHDKTLVTWEYAVVSTGVPRKNIYAGDTF